MANNVRMISYGAQEAFWAPITSDVNGNKIYGAPQPLIGLRAVDVQRDLTNTAYYADNKVHLSIPGTLATTGTLTTYQLSEEFKIWALGYEKQSNGMLTLSDNPNPLPYALMFKGLRRDELGNMYEDLMTLYNVVSVPPANANMTSEAETSPEELATTFTAYGSSAAVTESGKDANYSILEYNENILEVFENFGSKVLLPQDILTTDFTAPVITVTTPIITTYTTADNGTTTYSDLIVEAGITAMDNETIDLTASLIYTVLGVQYTGADLIDMDTVGDIIVKLDVKDAAGNYATQKTVTIDLAV